ncbi:hypothetical protein GCM10009554_22970 [Kribbella koreensis]|uniref:Uncharacterized protein n=1 Tax=Kribbella koreensis TaxID=57909 RepID=A0ABN1Q0X1_9ACTN
MTGRKLFRTGLALAGVAALATAALAAPAQAATTSATGTSAACFASVGSATLAHGQTTSSVSGTPPVKSQVRTTHDVYDQPAKLQFTTGYISEPNISGLDVSGYFVQAGGLYAHSFSTDGTGEIDPSAPNNVELVGGGWANFKSLETSVYDSGSTQRHTAYGLRNDGTLLRWTTGTTWRSTGSTAGFGSVKSMALIAKTASYDMFLANLSGGALYTIKIPTTVPMKTIVTKIRPSGWSSFEKLIANKCGASGTLLLGIDKDTKTGYTYAISHANGAATVIQSLGKVNGTFPDAVNFRWGVVPDLDPLTGG